MSSDLPQDHKAALQAYLDRGWQLVFWPAVKEFKGPHGAEAKGWTTREYTLDDYKPGYRVGVKLGVEVKPGHFLIDLDIDEKHPYAIQLMKRLMPDTGFAFGRLSKPFSHALYHSNEAIVLRQYIGIDKQMLLELRGTKADGSIGNQTMIPPSVHPSGEQIQLIANAEPALVERSVLERLTRNYAIALLLAKHLGHKALTHDARLPLAGFLLKANIEVVEVAQICKAIAEVLGNDAQDMALAVQTTAAKWHAGEKIKGGTALLDILGEPGKAILARINDWLGNTGDFIKDHDGKILANNQENIRRSLAKFEVVLKHDTFADKLMIVGTNFMKPLDDTVLEGMWLRIDKEHGYRPAFEFYEKVIRVTAREQPYHPVVDYLTDLAWDQEARIDTWLIKHGGAEDTPFIRAVSRLVLVAAVRRAKHPGCKFDELLVLESPQGFNKSTALKALCPNPAWFSDDLPLNVDAKRLIESTLGKWIIEAAELSGMHRSRVEHLKALLSRQIDGPCRLAYGRLPYERARAFIMIGTTNSDSYLKDTTGNRRFWPVRVPAFDVAALREVRDQLWAEAVVAEATGEAIRLDAKLWETATSQQEERRQADPWEIVLATAFPEGKTWKVEWAKVWQVLGIEVARQDHQAAERAIASLRRLGFTNRVFRPATSGGIRQKTVRGWYRSADQGVLLDESEEDAPF